jgi:hypothetical protein
MTRYVSCPGAPSDDEVLAPGNSNALAVLLESFAAMGFESSDLDSMQKVLAGLLHLGNVRRVEWLWWLWLWLWLWWWWWWWW